MASRTVEAQSVRPPRIASTSETAAIDAASSARRTCRVVPMLALGLALMTVATYWRVHGFDFVNYDDTGYVTRSKEITQGLSLGSVRWAFTSVYLANWHPLTNLCYLALYQFFGLNPRPYHLLNLFLHVGGTIGLLVAMMKLTGKPYRSALVAALFALHPLHVESVAWVSELKDCLSGVFWMLTIIAYVNYVRRPGGWRYTLMLVAFALGLMSKPMVVTLPFVLLLLDYWPLGRLKLGSASSSRQAGDHSAASQPIPLKRLLMEKAPLFLLAAVSCIVTVIAQGNAVASVENVPLNARLANSTIAYTVYLTKMFWPSRLSIIYPLTGHLAEWPQALALLLGMTAVALVFARTRPYLLVGWLWYLGTLLPVIGFVQVGDQAYADRYTYLPLIGPFIALVWGAWEASAALGERWRGIALTSAAVAVLVALSVRTWIQLGYWKNTDLLFDHAAQVVPNNANAQLVLGATWYLRGDPRKALHYYQEAVRLRPDYPDAYNRIGIAYVALDDLDRAGEAFAESLRYLRRDHDQARLDRDNRYQEAVYNMGLYCLKRGRLDEAEKYFLDRERSLPNDPKSHAALAALYNQRGYPELAARSAARALALDGTSTGAHFNLGWALEQLGRFEEAARQFQIVLLDTPPDPDARTHLSDVYRRLARMKDATAQLELATRENPRDYKLHFKLGALLQSQDQAGPAIVEYKTALALYPQSAARNNLAWLLATSADARLRDGKEAVRLAESVLSDMDAPTPPLLDTLAAAYAEAGDFDKAAATAQRAIDLATAAKNDSLRRQLQQRLELYQQHRPYREAQAITSTRPAN